MHIYIYIQKIYIHCLRHIFSLIKESARSMFTNMAALEKNRWLDECFFGTCSWVPDSLFHYSGMPHIWVVEMAGLKYGCCRWCDLLITCSSNHGYSNQNQPKISESCSQDLAWDDCQGHHRAAFPNLSSHLCAAIVALVAPVIPEFDLVVSGVRVVFAISLHEIFEGSP